METENKYYGLMNDLMFKYVFGRNENTKPLISLLNAILRLEGKNRIESIEILNPFNYGEYKDEKFSIVDTKAKDGNGFFYSIEVQNYIDQAFSKRMGYYLSKLYSSQLTQDDDYDSLKTATGIAFMDFDLFKSNKLHEQFMFKNKTGNITIKDFITMHFINVSKASLKKYINNQTSYYRWLQTLQYSKYYDKMKDELTKLIQDDEGMKMAIEMMDQANADLKMKMLLFDREESKRYSRYIINAPLRRLEKIKQKLKDKIKEDKEKLKEKENKLKEKDNKLKEKDNKLKEKDNKLKEKENKLKEKDEIINQTEAQLGEANRKLEQATEEAIEKLIHTCKSFGIDKYLVSEKLVVEYKLSKADATSKVEQYWNDNN